MQNESPSEPLDVLVFEVGGQRYGLPAADVLELVRAVTLMPLPGAPATVEGVMNLRGHIVPVLNIRAPLRLAPKKAEPSDHLIVTRSGGRSVAVRVDRALELARLSRGAIERTADVLPGLWGAAQVARLPDGLLLIHDLATFLSADALAALGPALGAPQAGEKGDQP